MFPNDLRQSHLLTRPAVGKMFIIPGGKGEELPGVQLDRWAGAMAAAVLRCAALRCAVLCCAVQGGAHAVTSH